MTRLTTCKTVRFISTLMVAVLLATCLPLTVFGAHEEDLLPEITQTENALDSGSVIADSQSDTLITGDIIGE